MRILVTGGLGFIGTNLIEKFLDNNFTNFIVVDNLINAYGINKKIEYKTHIQDITDFESLFELSKDCSHIIHLAGLGSVPRSIADPQSTFQANVVGTQNVLECARLHNSKVIFSSSSSVFGNEGNYIRSENSPKGPVSPYGYSKYIDELLITSYFESFKVNRTILRFFNVFGPYQTVKNEYAAVIPKMLEAVKRNQEFEIHGDGEQSRDFTYVGDVVSIIWDIIQNSKSYIDYLNIAWGKKTTLNQLIQIIRNNLGLNLKCVNKDSRIGDIKNSQNDGLKIRKLYPLVNPIDIESALRLTADWYLDQNL